jgi:putative tricarboxylic transport membrane protein
LIEVGYAFADALVQVLAWATLKVMLIGILAGIVVGILPGLGGPTTLALMLPFIFTMQPVEAFAFLLGMSSVTGTTGDVTSVLFGVPGEGTAAATVIDGHAMAKKGEAGRALGAVLSSSLVGSIFGAFVLALAIPIVRPVVLSFSSPEFFMLAMLGISFMAALSGQRVLKGVIIGALGLIVATVGRDPISGIERFTFGQIFLWDGIGLVPVTIGLFAIPETIDLAARGTSIARGGIARLGGVKEGIRDTFRHWRLVLRCSAIGAYAGIVPGMGGTVGQWLAYAHAGQSTADEKQFGKGAVEGVVGPGAANNSSAGGSLIPTIAFGIPGSIPMAILLGAFMIQGLVPGPNMLIPDAQGGHLSVTFSFVWTIVIANIITVAIFFLFLPQLVKLTHVRGGLLIPFILLLVYLGAFAEKNAFPDLLVMLAFGILGWFMVQLDWPRPPLILGLVLGSVAEQKLFISTVRYGLTWLMRPMVIVMMILLVAVLIYPLMKRRRADKALPGKMMHPGADLTEERVITNPRWELLSSLLLPALFAWTLWTSSAWSIRAGLFPWSIGTLGLLLSALYAAQRLGEAWRKAIPERQSGIDPTKKEARKRIAEILCWILFYFLAIWLLGFSVATPLLTFGYLRFAAHEKWHISLILAVVAFAVLYFLFDRTLHVPFPTGQAVVWFSKLSGP